MHNASNSQHDSGIDISFESASRKSSSQPTPSPLDAQLYQSTDGRLIPQSTVEGIANKLKTRASRTYVELHTFAKQENVAFASIQNIIGAYAGQDWPRVVIDVDHQSYLCSDGFADGIKSRISEAVTTSGSNMCDLTGAVGHSIPSPMVFALATEVVPENHGEIQFAGDHVVYLHSCDSCKAKKNHAQARTQQTAELIQQIDQHGYCVIAEPKEEVEDDDSLSRAVLWDYQESHPGRGLMHVIASTRDEEEDGTERRRKILVEPAVLHEELGFLKQAMTNRTEVMWRSDPSAATLLNIINALEPSDFPNQPRSKLVALLLHSDYAQDLERSAQHQISELDREQHDIFIEIIERQIWCPLHLYAAGTIATLDPILKKDLEAFVTEHFRREIIPRAIESVIAQNLRFNPKRKEALTILNKARDDLQTFGQLQDTVVHIGDCLEISPPSESLVMKVKHASLRRTADAMQNLTSAVEIIQNLLWVLLATSGPGLFISSVKYTSRMIARYDAIGDPEITGLLNLWWAKVKEGKHDGEDLRQMKELGQEAIKMWMEGD